MVIDASAAVRAGLSQDGFARLVGFDLHAPQLLRSEATAALAQLCWRREITAELAVDGLRQVLDAPVQYHGSKDLYRAALRLSRTFGWAKSYDAEYVVLAQLRREPLLTIDARLADRARAVVDVVGPADL